MTPQQEAFAQAFIETGNASEAYRRAYNVKPSTKAQSVHSNACNLLANTEVARRIQELKGETAERHAITRDDLVRMMLEDRKTALEANDGGTANACTMNLAKFLGEYTETKNVKTSNVNHNIETNLSPLTEWVEGIAAPTSEAAPKGARTN